MQPNRRLLLPLLLNLGLAFLALAASPAEAQLESWGASGDVRMRYRTEVGAPLLTRTAATVPETVESDIIVDLKIGGTSSIADEDPGTMSLSSVGDSRLIAAPPGEDPASDLVDRGRGRSIDKGIRVVRIGSPAARRSSPRRSDVPLV